MQVVVQYEVPMQGKKLVRLFLDTSRAQLNTIWVVLLQEAKTIGCGTMAAIDIETMPPGDIYQSHWVFFRALHHERNQTIARRHW